MSEPICCGFGYYLARMMNISKFWIEAKHQITARESRAYYVAGERKKKKQHL